MAVAGNRKISHRGQMGPVGAEETGDNGQLSISNAPQSHAPAKVPSAAISQSLLDDAAVCEMHAGHDSGKPRSSPVCGSWPHLPELL